MNETNSPTYAEIASNYNLWQEIVHLGWRDSEEKFEPSVMDGFIPADRA